MLAKLWKKVLMFILIVACLFNVCYKLVHNISLEQELLSSAQYIQDRQDAEKAKKEEEEKEKSQENNNTKTEENGKENQKEEQERTVVIN